MILSGVRLGKHTATRSRTGGFWVTRLRGGLGLGLGGLLGRKHDRIKQNLVLGLGM